MQIDGASREDGLINAYSKDLRLTALAAAGRGVPRREVVAAFGASIVAVKRRREGGDLAPRPSPGRASRILATEEEKRTL